jgi:hypothetical protein
MIFVSRKAFFKQRLAAYHEYFTQIIFLTFTLRLKVGEHTWHAIEDLWRRCSCIVVVESRLVIFVGGKDEVLSATQGPFIFRNTFPSFAAHYYRINLFVSRLFLL